MKCCQNCFIDSYITQFFVFLTNETGVCDFCESKDVFVVEPNVFRTIFEPLVDTYTLSEQGKFLVQCLMDDWRIFDTDKMNMPTIQALLGDILDDANIIKRKYTLPTSSDDTALEKWNEFKEELKHSNRFFVKSDINKEALTEMFQYVNLLDKDKPENWYRARLQQSKMDIFSPHEMGAPPKEKVSHGRANPAGIPYLYIASTKDTAVSEVRPHTGDSVCVAKIKLDNDMKLLDLRNPIFRVSPFEMLANSGNISDLKSEVEFLERLGEELTRPVRREAAAYDYVPSQYLCELIKNNGYDGVVYRSSTGDGFNAALFYPSSINIIDVKSLLVRRVSVVTDD